MEKMLCNNVLRNAWSHWVAKTFTEFERAGLAVDFEGLPFLTFIHDAKPLS